MSFQSPMPYNEILQQKGLLDDIYKALSTLDGSAVLEAYKIMSITKSFPSEHKHVKNYDRSCVLRSRGNDYFQEQNYQAALEKYNKALLCAPIGSLEMLHAYGNRSALLYHLSAYSACIKDIEMCRKLGCTGQLAKKLNKRYDQCQLVLWEEHLKTNVLLSNFGKEFFQFNVKKHPDVPCLSADVDIVSESGERKAVAAKDIKLGTVVAVETAFATYSLEDKSFLSCHHCQKMTPNLTPCDTCSYALFCSDQCQKHSFKEYHNIECQITGILQTINAGFKFRLAIKSVLKLRNMCKNWSTFNKEANNIGATRLNESPLNEVYDVENYSSILCFKEDRCFVFGTLFHCCFLYAAVIQHLERIKGFFPESISDRLEARKCFGKVCLNLHLNWIATELVTSAEKLHAGQVINNVPSYYGWFPFTGKLRHSCEPNLLALGLDNKVALVAIRPIKKTTELTMSYVGHWYENLYEEARRMKIYQSIFNVCRCRVCEGSWGDRGLPQPELDPKQKKLYHSWQHMLNTMVVPHKDASFYRMTCVALASLDPLPNTEPHYKVFVELRSQLSLCQYAHTGNEMIFQ